MGFQFVGIQENTHKLQGCGRREGFTLGDRDIGLCKQRKGVTGSCEGVRPWELSNKKEVIQEYPLVKEVRSTPQAEGENGVEVVQALPFHAYGPIYTIRLCRIRQVYDRLTT